MANKNLKIVFFGTPEFAVASLDRLVRNGFDVAAVVTMPDKIGGRGHKVIQSAVKDYAVAHNLPLLQPEKLKDPEFVEALRAIGADLFIVIAFRMLPEVVWTMPPMGTFNLHGSLLPRYRGAAPINRAVMNGDTETGVTTFFLKHEIDTGDIIGQEKISVGPDEDAGSVYDRLMEIGAELTCRTVSQIAEGGVEAVPQLKMSDIEPTLAPKIFKEDCHINWNSSAAHVHNHVRGLAPHPGAWTELHYPDGNILTVKILKTRLSDGCTQTLSPGELAIIGRDVLCGCADGCAVVLETVQPAGKKAMPAPDFARGLRLGEDGVLPCFK